MVDLRSRRFPALGLSAIAGAALVLTLPEPSWWWLVFVALVPWMLLVRSAPTLGDAALRVWCAGAGYFLAVSSWMFSTAGPAVLLVAAALGATWIPAGWVAWRLRPMSDRGGRALAMVLVPAAWVAGEYVRSWDVLGGPWGLLGVALSGRPGGGMAAIGGTWSVSAVVVAVNMAVVLAVEAPWWVGRVRYLGVAAATIAGALVVGGADAGESVGNVRVAVVQPGWVDDPGDRFARHERLTETLIGRGAELIVWGESTVAFDLDGDDAHRGRLQRLAAVTGAELLVGVDARRQHGGITKSTTLVSPEEVVTAYDKTRLVPFGEYVPLRPLLGWVAGFTRAADEDRVVGGGATLVATRRVPVGPLICFESVFPDMARRVVADGAGLVVVQSANTTFEGTWAQPQHAQVAVARAVEVGRPVVHASVNGTSVVVDATGRTLAEVPAAAVGTIVTDVAVTEEETVYVRVGDVVPRLAVVLVVAAGALVVIRRRTRTPVAER